MAAKQASYLGYDAAGKSRTSGRFLLTGEFLLLTQGIRYFVRNAGCEVRKLFIVTILQWSVVNLRWCVCSPVYCDSGDTPTVLIEAMTLRHCAVDVATALRVQCGSSLIHPWSLSLFARSISTGRKRMLEKLWRDFFSNPTEWWDNRPEKGNQRYPDFKHRMTQQSLWLTDNSNPPWVETELAAMTPGTLQVGVFTWNRRLARYVKEGQYENALKLLYDMLREGMCPDKFTFVRVLNACSNLKALDEGRRIHAEIVKSGCESDIYVGNSLVDMYAKCGSIEDAQKVFNTMPKHDVVSWNAMILGCVKCCEAQKALKLFREMQRDAVYPDRVTFLGALSACATAASLDDGRCVHAQIIQSGCQSDVFVACSIVDMYAKCGSIECAWAAFSEMLIRSVASWNAMILGYVNCGEGLKALDLFRQMEQDSVRPNRVTFLAVLNACAIVAALDEGRRIHEQIIESGYEFDVFVGTSIVDMYAKCGSLEDACAAFKKMPIHNAASWNAMILGYIRCQQAGKALKLFQQMHWEGIEPNPATFVGVLSACANTESLGEGRWVHEQIMRRGFCSDVFVCNSLVDMYCKCGSTEDAMSFFNKMVTRDVVSWNVIILGYIKCGKGQEALDLFLRMQQEGVYPDRMTFVGVLKACAREAALDKGRTVHEQISRSGYESDTIVASSIVDMYAKCGSIQDACTAFDKMAIRNVVSWNAMILGYVNCGEDQKALDLFEKMQQEGVSPDLVTFVGLLNACASLAALEEGRSIHHQLIQKGYNSDVRVSNCLVDMYAKCGSIEDARRIFQDMPMRDIISWSAMLGGYARHGYAKEALGLFGHMCKVVAVNGVTFISLLSACRHGVLVDEGLHYFESMSSVYNISPTLEHLTCVVDLLSCAGHLHEAEDLMKSIPYEPYISAWRSLLGACKLHGNVDMGERVAKRVLNLEPANASSYILLSNIYAEAGKWDSSARIHRERLEKHVKVII